MPVPNIVQLPWGKGVVVQALSLYLSFVVGGDSLSLLRALRQLQ